MFPFAGKRCGDPFEGGGPGRHGMFEGLGSKILHDLDLTDEQIEQIAELKAEGMAEGMKLMSEGSRYFKHLMRELTSETIDKEKVKNAHIELQEHKTKVGDAMLERALSFSQTLTPEQRKKLQASMKRRFLGVYDSHGADGSVFVRA